MLLESEVLEILHSGVEADVLSCWGIGLRFCYGYRLRIQRPLMPTGTPHLLPLHGVISRLLALPPLAHDHGRRRMDA